MPSSYKILGQVCPANANALSALYTVPAATTAVISTITVCNLQSSNNTFGIAVRPAGATIATSHYVAYGAIVPALDTIVLTLGLTVSATDVISVSASTANAISFNCFGSQIT
jgi:hypothetical protein